MFKATRGLSNDFPLTHRSKSELKKRNKQRELEEKKKQRAAAAPAKAEKHVSAEEAENNLTPNVCTATPQSIFYLE